MSDSPLVSHAGARSLPVATRSPHVRGAASVARPMAVFTGPSRSNDANYSVAALCKLEWWSSLYYMPKYQPTCRSARESVDNASSTASPQPHHYPNPGFLGSSSHSAIFNQLRTSDSHLHDALQPPVPPPRRHMPKNNAIVEKAIHALKQLCPTDMSHLNSLVHVWLDQGVNLPLAGPLVAPIAAAVAQSANATSSDDWVSQHTVLLENTDRPITLHRDMSVSDFFSQLLGHGLRWDVLGIFFAAASRAALDTTSFPPLYTGEAQRWDLITSLTYIGDSCLDMCLAADCLDDLQLILQYENCIVHSQVDGDQSKSNHTAEQL